MQVSGTPETGALTGSFEAYLLQNGLVHGVDFWIDGRVMTALTDEANRRMYALSEEFRRKADGQQS